MFTGFVSDKIMQKKTDTLIVIFHNEKRSGEILLIKDVISRFQDRFYTPSIIN